MATIPGPNMLQLPLAPSVDGGEYVWIVQGGVDKRTTLASISIYPIDDAPFVVATASPGLLQSRLLAAEAGVTTVTDGGALANITVGIATNGIGNAQFRQSTGLSVVGNAGVAEANVADITGATDQILLVNGAGTGLGFGSIDLSKSAAVGASVLQVVNGGTGVASQEPTVVTTSSASIAAKTGAVAVQRVAPSTTALALPAVAAQDGIPIHIFDWSSSVTDHTITITPDGSETIMLQASYPISSNTVSLAGVTLYPSTTLSGWYIAP